MTVFGGALAPIGTMLLLFICGACFVWWAARKS